MTTRVKTLWRVHVTSLTTSVSTTTRFLIEIKFILNTINHILKSHMINRILHSWSFYSWSFQMIVWLVGCFGLNGPLRQYFSL